MTLVPIWIDGRAIAGFVELRDLLRSQLPAHGEQILPELLFVARADNDIVYRWTLQEPI